MLRLTNKELIVLSDQSMIHPNLPRPSFISYFLYFQIYINYCKFKLFCVFDLDPLPTEVLVISPFLLAVSIHIILFCNPA